MRYRHDSKRQFRYTTVELVVERTPIQRRADRMVEVSIPMSEKSLRTIALAGGAIWDPKARLWSMPRNLALRLGLLDPMIKR